MSTGVEVGCAGFTWDQTWLDIQLVLDRVERLGAHSGWSEDDTCRMGVWGSNDGQFECCVSASTGDQRHVFGEWWLEL